MGLLSTGPLNRVMTVTGDDETLTVFVEDNRPIRIPTDLLVLAARHTPLPQDAWETGLWDRAGSEESY